MFPTFESFLFLESWLKKLKNPTPLFTTDYQNWEILLRNVFVKSDVWPNENISNHIWRQHVIYRILHWSSNTILTAANPLVLAYLEWKISLHYNLVQYSTLFNLIYHNSYTYFIPPYMIKDSLGQCEQTLIWKWKTKNAF